jgi:hypothetical protein
MTFTLNAAMLQPIVALLAGILILLIVFRRGRLTPVEG